jgi:intracellular multiplication protein IcmD
MKKKYWFLVIATVLFPMLGIAATTSQVNLGEMSDTIGQSLKGISTLIIGLATVAGLGFGVAAIFKFKQHRDNPTQVPLGQPLSLLAIAVFLLWLQFLLQSAGRTVAGDEVGTGQGKLETAPDWLQKQ